MSLRFQWDRLKARSNLRKHGVNFSEASTVFADPLSITISDPIHSHSESRFIDIGLSYARRLLVVSYVERGDDVHIISARPATRREQRQYEEAT